MRSRRIFSWIWRANALLIFLAGTLTVVLGCVLLYKLVADATRTREVHGVMNVAEQEIDRSKASLSGFEIVPGSKFLKASLYVEQEYEFGSGSKESRSVQNELYFDTVTRKSHWLIPQHKGMIDSQYRLPEDRSYGDDPPPVRAQVYALTDRDDNGDGKLTPSDLKEIAISGPAGKPLYRTGLRVDSIDGAHIADEGSEVLVFHTVGGKFRVLAFDLATGKLVSNAELNVD